MVPKDGWATGMDGAWKEEHVREFNELTITAAALGRVSAAPDARMRQVSDALVRHLHAFVREIEPSFEEWMQGIEFLTRTGQMCDDKRQEFILLSDTLGVSMLVDAINHRGATGATETTVLGPFYVEAAPARPLGADISAGLAGEPLLVTGSVSIGRRTGARRRHGRRLAFGRRRLLRRPAPRGDRRPRLASALLRRRERPLPFLDDQAEGLSDTA